jgi:hypothetical protein
MALTICPNRLRQFGSPAGTFVLVTNPALARHLTLEEDGAYDGYQVVLYDQDDGFDTLLRRLPEPAHVLVISPEHFMESPPAEVLGKRRKLIALACNSTPTSLEAIAYFLAAIERTDPVQQDAFAERFFTLAEASSQFELVDEHYRTTAVFQHQSDGYQWQQQAGLLDWGDQQIAPAGEISVLPYDLYEFRADARLAITGELTVHGYPIVHGGKTAYARQEQARIYQALAGIIEHAIIATVAQGVITHLRGTHPRVQPAVAMFEELFAADPHYQIIWEVGHGFNSAFEILPGNHAANEVYGGQHGVIHLGLGLTPFTTYHLDLLLPQTRIVGAGHHVLLGPGSEHHIS